MAKRAMSFIEDPFKKYKSFKWFSIVHIILFLQKKTFKNNYVLNKLFDKNAEF